MPLSQMENFQLEHSGNFSQKKTSHQISLRTNFDNHGDCSSTTYDAYMHSYVDDHLYLALFN